MVEARPRNSLLLQCYRTDSSAVDPPIVDQVAFLQEWLFFGTLAEVSAICGLCIDIKAEFLVNGGREISTAALNGLAQRWLDAARMQTPGDDFEARMRRVHSVVGFTTSLSHHGGSRVVETQKLSYPECKALFAIGIVYRVVTLMLKRSGVCDARKLDRLHFALLGGFPALQRELSAFAREELLQKGWCRSEVTMLDAVDPDGPPYHFFASLLRRQHMNHSGCSWFRCLADNIDEDTYQTAHAKAECQCAFASVNGDDLAEILAKDEVPRIMISDDLDVNVVQNRPYVVISHVCKCFSLLEPNLVLF